MAVVLVAGLVAASCGSADRSSGGSDDTGSITVAAAASLTEAFTRIGRDFETANPGTQVTFTFDSTSSLAAQIRRGAPADVFASADEASVAALAREGLVAGRPTLFARNRLAIVAKPGNPRGIESLADLVDAGVVSVCNRGAPCGRLAGEALARAGVDLPERNVTRGENVRSTLTAVTEGDADAAIVYVTDARGAGDRVTVVAIPAGQNATARYPIAVLRDAGRARVARAFVRYVASPAGRSVLARDGFLAP